MNKFCDGINLTPFFDRNQCYRGYCDYCIILYFYGKYAQQMSNTRFYSQKDTPLKKRKQQTQLNIKVLTKLLTLNARKFDPHHNFVLAPQVSAIFNALDSPSL